ncbi:MAG TPA: adenylate/guanylate cyclase domain-containing protein [Acidimicrobiales bacterium]|nr:adenylate/guanylate cyclase domain-containing protein [Acidimicrobiales bacterium]
MPETRYAVAGDVHVAYQVLGEGPRTVVMVMDWFGNVELMWESSDLAAVLERLASICRVVVFDKRGVGLSDPVSRDGLPPLETWIDDVSTVLSSVGADRATLLGVGAGGPMVMQFAGTHPERVDRLVLVNTYARLARAADYPAGVPEAVRDRILAVPYDDDATADTLAGASRDPSFRSWWRRYQRQSVSPSTARAMREMLFQVDVRSVLGSIQAPTLILHRRDNPWIRVAHSRHLAQHIEGAELVELDGDEDLFFLGQVDELVDHVEAFLTGSVPSSRSERVLVTVLFTDLVGSTEVTAQLGDARWRRLRQHHDTIVARCLQRHRGRLVSTAGDGTFAVFDGPGRAIRCARSIAEELEPIGLRVRAGVHTGEVELSGDSVDGIAVNIGARVAAMAGAGQVLVTSTVRDLMSGSGLSFRSLGGHTLKGVPEPWQILAVE